EALREELIGAFGYAPDAAARLSAIYGTRATEIARIAAADSALAAPLAEHSLATGAEIVWAFEQQQAVGLTDAVIRRAMAGWEPDLGRAVARGTARIGRSHLGWTADRVEAELDEYES